LQYLRGVAGHVQRNGAAALADERSLPSSLLLDLKFSKT
jgi:hypothetical protein